MKCAYCGCWLYEQDRWRLHAEPHDRRAMTPDLFFCTWRCLADYALAQATENPQSNETRHARRD